MPQIAPRIGERPIPRPAHFLLVIDAAAGKPRRFFALGHPQQNSGGQGCADAAFWAYLLEKNLGSAISSN